MAHFNPGEAAHVDWKYNVIDGHGIHPAFGTRFGIPVNSTVDIWSGAASIRPLPLDPKPMYVRSDSVSDVYGVGGAELVLVTFIADDGHWYNSDLLVMNGTTNVPITYKPEYGKLGNNSRPPTTPTAPDGSSVVASVFRIQDMTVVKSLGATEDAPRAGNIGNLRVVDVGGKVFEHMPIGAGRSRSACFHCPAGYTARLTYAPVGTARGQGTAYIAANFGLDTTWNLLPVAAVDGATALFDPDSATTPVLPRADVQAVCVSSSNSIDVSHILQFRLIPIE